MATVIQIKRSANVAAPSTTDLVEGELAYSYDKTGDGAGAKLYIEALDSGNNETIHVIGGKYYTDIVDSATSANTAGKLVKRDGSGNFSAGIITATLYGAANTAATATALATTRYINLTGDASGTAAFDGTGNADISVTIGNNSIALGTDTTGDYVSNVAAGTGIAVTGSPHEGWIPTIGLTNTGVSASTYGGISKIPVITVDAQGRITSAANVNVDTGVSAGSITVFTNKTYDVSVSSNNKFSIQGNQISSYTGSGSSVVLSQSPTISVLNISDSQINLDGGSGTYYWGGQSGVAQAGDLKAGVYASDPSSNNSLFTFGTNGSNNMSVGVEGSLFIGTSRPSNNGGLNTTYPGWLVVQSGGKFGGTINTLGALQFDDVGTGKIIFADGTEQNTAFKTSVLTTANVAEVTNLYFTNARAQAALTGASGVSYNKANGTISLATSGVTATTYGGATSVPVLTVDNFGRITSASNTTISTDLLIAADSGTDTVSLASETLKIAGGTGITTSVTSNIITVTNAGVTALSSGGYGISVSGSTGSVSVTNTGVTRAIAGTGISVDTNNGNVTFTNTGVTSITGTANEIEVSSSTGGVTIGLPNNVTIGNDLSVTGNLYVTGNVVALPVENLVIEDSLIQLANNNISTDIIDIGFFGSYNSDGGEHEHAGLFRDASDGLFKLFKGLQGQGNLTTTVNISGTGYSTATLVADLLASNANVTTALSFGNGKHQIVPLTSSVLEVRGGLGDASGALSLAAGNYPTAYSKIYLESGKKITAQSDEFYFTLFNDGNTKVVTMNTTHTAAVSTSTGAVRISGGLGMTGNLYANYLNGTVDGGTY